MIDINNLKVDFENKVLQSDKVIIVPHKMADFDAIGSAIGISLATKKLKKDPIIIVDDKSYEQERGVHAIIQEAKSEHLIKSRCKYLNDMSDNDLYILTDVNKSYLITLNDEIKDEDKVMIIDHHEEDDKSVKSNYKYIDPKASSASEIIT